MGENPYQSPTSGATEGKVPPALAACPFCGEATLEAGMLLHTHQVRFVRGEPGMLDLFLGRGEQVLKGAFTGLAQTAALRCTACRTVLIPPPT